MIKVELQGYQELRGVLDSNQAVRAAAFRSLNRTADGMRTDISTEVRRSFNIAKRDVDPRIQVTYCDDYYSLQAGVVLKAGEKSALPLISFGAVDRRNLAQGSIKTMKGRSGFYSQRLKRQVGQAGVTYKIMKSGDKGFSANAFIIPGGRGSLQVVRRAPGQKGNKGLKEKRVMSVAGMVASSRQSIMQRIEEAARLRLAKNFEREWAYYKDRAERGQLIGNKGDLYRK